MNSTRMIEIAAQLGHCYAKKSELSLKIAVAQKLDAELQVRSTPAEGWPGKNAEERKLAAERAGMENAHIAEQRGIIAMAEAELSGLQAGIDSLEAERRALEWEVRSVLALALSGKQEVKGNPENTAFDDAPIGELEQELEDELAGMAEPELDDIPF
jgi:hypothetical protein